MINELTAHLSIQQNLQGKDWLCGDIHGQYEELLYTMEQNGFNPFLDRVFLLGDLVDRGPQSKELLNWALFTSNVYSVMGNHELTFAAGAWSPRHRQRHLSMGGQWSDQLAFEEYRRLAQLCIKSFPLTITLECEQGTLGLVHAQSPSDDWLDAQRASVTERFAVDCTWPWNRAQGPAQIIKGVTAVVSGHIGMNEIVRRGNQFWIDTLEQTGNITLIPAAEIFKWMKRT
ncbi:metallophosphoesterase [Marinobacter sp. G11]|jgi:serine/threonine protein phosphatase 1|uniref:Metallophosphoesterase n=1 Tax=Marinobacter nauticus (strain ATCC 700491 / DSM 11845 / VT8) TaxID=351348 RepID=A1TXN9_MARN8|nr:MULTISPECIES: metallophosphoesterase [Marinobacter]ABM17508.1 metallophosphoesterase [Marinobacter nauticus VT8]MCE0760056.1 metallophosphoesterase [Marinobacter sp. G11]